MYGYWVCPIVKTSPKSVNKSLHGRMTQLSNSLDSEET